MPDEFPSDPEKNFEFWTDSAREQVEEGEQMLRLMGLDDHTIQAMRKAMEQLYDPATGTLDLDDFDKFKDAVLPSLLDSPIMEETLDSTRILIEPRFERFIFTFPQMQPCLGEVDLWLEENEKSSDNFNVARVLMDEQMHTERAQLGVILLLNFMELINEELEQEIYQELYALSQSSNGEMKEQAKNAMASFTLFPGQSNAFLQFLFIKSFIQHAELKEGIEEIADGHPDVQEVVAVLENSLFTILCEGEDAYHSKEMSNKLDWDDDGRDDENWDEDEEGEDKEGNKG